MTTARNKTTIAGTPRMASVGKTAVIAAVAVVATLIALGTHAASPAIERFFGIYEGTSTSVPEGETAKRNLHLTIKPYKDGFTVGSQDEIHATGARPHTEKLSVDFAPTRRKNIYASAMRTDLFGNPVPLDPLEGGPYVWATLSADILTVYVLKITEAGAQDLQIYKRTLTAQGLDVEFTWFRDSDPIRRIDASLKKIGKAAPQPPAAQGPVRPLFVPEN